MRARLLGQGSAAVGSNSTALGESSLAGGPNDTAIGQNAHVFADQGVAVGQNATIGTGAFDSVAVGQNSSIGAHSTQSVAVGQGATVLANLTNSTVVGNQAQGNASNTTVVGQGASANANGAAAYGQGAVANLSNEQVFGTTANTYTTPGITSGLSASRQSGPLDIVTTDAAGHLASDGGSVFNALSKLEAGVAIAMSQQNPDLVASENFGIAMNAGFFDQSQALGFSAEAVAARNLFGFHDRLAFSGGVGFSLNEPTFGNRTADTQVGGHVGAQLTW